jgi:hypothetical protein
MDRRSVYKYPHSLNVPGNALCVHQPLAKVGLGVLVELANVLHKDRDFWLGSATPRTCMNVGCMPPSKEVMSSIGAKGRR